MNRPHKYVSPLTEDETATLKELNRNHPSHRVRVRAHAVLLSSGKFCIDEIASVWQADRDSVSAWLRAWEKNGITGLYDLPRSGTPSKLTESDIETVKECIAEHPNFPKGILAKSIEKIGKIFSISTLKRIAKNEGMCWKRIRKSVKDRRDPQKFEKVRKQIEHFKEQQKSGESDLFFFDQTGFCLGSSVPYAWQPVGGNLRIPSSGSRRLNTLGFYSPDNRFESFCFECTVNTDVVSVCFDKFSETLSKKTVVFLDNAPMHHSDEFEANVPKWRKKNLYVRYLPEYSPELSPIETVWNFIKKHWLPVSAWLSYENLVNSVEYILKNIGSEFKINFSP